ncbi:division/cell wall cluster transcriptional repressor MraZ [Cognatazoarcus halotolerans]|uniref:division/cell wall cluster transcriptional repressor MraZ n=1 Tax=Cognatazoarcus halotolerans TaxID=2686016 RepID=UPI0013585BF1|nr:division/cell wall cluster transcriptional repressor MraZ [Cognatazoarcus halotolerans]MBX3679733.1 division/cell wall cluster transcriptional repressor MraZ [Rhodocyclaceae bacterium]MCB1898755.1 division/cell wall cluster transcriptional repressor MraZ [Rhodocyclaceae bacterium]MCP5311121.1 division/cell wall cluster transcriptional repressor MraZ [Zoogloeaceae bacterium]
MFQGAAALNVDAKGRVAIPTRHRDALSAIADGHLVLTAHPHRCLLVYPAPAWEPIKEKVLAGSSLEQKAAILKRLLVGFAREETLDSAGRVLISQELRSFAQLEKKVWLVGQGSHFELWSDAGWAAQQEAMLALGADLLPPGMEDFSL